MSETRERYIFDQALELERARLTGLTATFDPVTMRTLRTVGLAPGWHCLEIGAGTGSIAVALAETVGDTGRVLATDLDTRYLTDLGPGIEVARHDIAADPLEPAAFDLIHARAVLEHLPDRAKVIAKLVEALRPGGVLVLEDFIFDSAVMALHEGAIRPRELAPGLVRAVGAVATGFRAIGADPRYGVELPADLREAGLDGVDAELVFRLIEGGGTAAQFFWGTISELAPKLIGAGLLDPADADQAVTLLRAPGSRWFSIGVVSAWGRRP
jgi:SAM-dependent methyltransferase